MRTLNVSALRPHTFSTSVHSIWHPFRTPGHVRTYNTAASWSCRKPGAVLYHAVDHLCACAIFSKEEDANSDLTCFSARCSTMLSREVNVRGDNAGSGREQSTGSASMREPDSALLSQDLLPGLRADRRSLQEIRWPGLLVLARLVEPIWLPGRLTRAGSLHH
jgi:hypothetical protein